MFDFESYVESSCAVMARSGAGELVLRECPNCGKGGKCYVNPRKGKFICFSCGFKGPRPERFIAKVEGITEARARIMMMGEIQAMSRPKRAALELFVAKKATVAPGLPPEYIPCFDKTLGKWRGIPTYIRERGIEKATIKAFKLGWCTSGPYAGRVIVPIITNGLISFQARATWKLQPGERKYDSPSGAPHSSMLFGYHLVKPGYDLWVVEGPFDVIGCYQAGLSAVGLLGKQVSDTQVALIARMRPRAIHVMLDTDALPDMVRVAMKLAVHAPTDYVVLEDKDPGATPPERLKILARNFRQIRRSAQILGVQDL